MKKVITVIATLFVIGIATPTCEAQGFLKKVNKKLEQTNQKLKKMGLSNNASSGTASSSSSQSATESSTTTGYDDEVKEIKMEELHPELPMGKIDRSDNNISFKETPTTKYINVNDDIELSDFHDGMALVREGRNYYFISSTGEKCPFNSKIQNPTISSGVDGWPRFDNGRALIKTNNCWVIIDKEGKIVKTLPATICFADRFSSGIARIKHLNSSSGTYKYEFIDINGVSKYPALSYSVEPRLDQKADFVMREKSEGLIAVDRYDPATKSNKWGFFNEKGVYTISPKYYAVHDFKDGLAAVQEVVVDGSYPTGGKWGFINTHGEVVIDFVFSREPGDFDNGYAMVANKEGDNVVIDKTGAVVFRPERGWDISPLLNGYAIYAGTEVINNMNGRILYAVRNGGKDKVAYEVGDFITVKILNGNAYYSNSLLGGMSLLDIPTLTTKISGLIRPFSEGIAAVPDGYVNEKGEYIVRFKASEF